MSAEQTELVARALAEDIGAGDVTAAATVPADALARATIVRKAPGVISGLDVAAEVFAQAGAPAFERLAPEAVWEETVPGEVATVCGPARAVLAGERTALNFLQQLSGVATITRRFADLAKPARVYDTRKTTPGLREFEKYAVRCGGGYNHRMGLHDGVMIKDNHIAALGDLEVLREKVGELAAKGKPIVLEASTHDQALLFATFPIQVLMLDNFTVAGLRRTVRAVRKLNPDLQIEASGGVNLKTVRAIGNTGVDRVSVGALTHSAPAVDISLEL